MAGRAKKKYQPWADLVATYGLGILRLPGGPRIDRQLLVGLWACARRTDDRRGAVIRAAVADSACATPALRYWRADCHDEAEARYRHDLHASRVAYLSRPVSPPDEVFSEPAEAACEPPAEMATPTQGA